MERILYLCMHVSSFTRAYIRNGRKEHILIVFFLTSYILTQRPGISDPVLLPIIPEHDYFPVVVCPDEVFQRWHFLPVVSHTLPAVIGEKRKEERKLSKQIQFCRFFNILALVWILRKLL